MSISAFALRSFSGTPTRFFRVEKDDLRVAQSAPQKSPSHLILVIDRSGSMYGDMEAVKSMTEKLLTVEEFNDPRLRVSLISYSSSGDVTLHFKHVTVGEVMAASSPHIKAIRSLRATALTCISQGLAMAETLIDDKEITCVTLHTDGFANDSSPSAESRAIGEVVKKLKTHPGVFVNTIAYRGYCDFTLLSGISNALSGVCIQARDIRQVHDALTGAMKLLAGSMTPAIEISRGAASYMTFVSRSANKILGTSDNLVVRGLSEKDDRVAYRYFEISEAEYQETPVPAEAILAFARAQISEGRLSAAKYALVASKNEALLKTHSKALVASDVAAFAAAVEAEIVSGSNYIPSKDYGLPTKGPSVLKVLSILDASSSSLSVHLPILLAGYKRRGLKRIPGTREEGKTEITPPKYESRYRSREEWVSVNGFELNRNTATINMLLSQPIDIYPVGGEQKIVSVEGVDLGKLRSFNNYTLVGDGSLNVSQLLLRTNDKRCFKELKDIGAVTGEYKPNEPFAIDFSEMPLVAYDASFDAFTPNEVRELARVLVLQKILSGIFKGDSTSLTADQIKALSEYHLTSGLNFSPPTTTEYVKLEDAIAQGKVDTKLSYKIDLGIPSFTSPSKLKSGNEYLQRRFTLESEGKKVEKPTLDYLGKPGSKWALKALTARTTLDTVDDLSFPVYEGITGLGSEETVLRLLALTEDPKIDGEAFLATLRGTDRDAAVAAVSDANSSLSKIVESFYDRVRPLAFYIGATGLVPDSLDAVAYTAEQFIAKYPDAKLSKKETEEGTFFVLPNGLVITVYVEGEYFTVC